MKIWQMQYAERESIKNFLEDKKPDNDELATAIYVLFRSINLNEEKRRTLHTIASTCADCKPLIELGLHHLPEDP